MVLTRLFHRRGVRQLLTVFVLIAFAQGCQFSTRTGMYRGYVGWRQFIEPQLVLERAPLKDEEPSLWGPRLKTHALRWHDKDFSDPRYAYTPRPEISRTSGQQGEKANVAQLPTSEPSPAPPAAANRPARLEPRAPVPPPIEPLNNPAPPLPPPGETLLPAEGEPKTPSNMDPSNMDPSPELPLPPAASDDKVTNSGRMIEVPNATVSIA